MASSWWGVVAALLTLGFVIELLRRGILRERFAGLWLAVSAAFLLVAVVPGIARRASQALGFVLPSNFLFFVAILFLLAVAVQLSYEVSRLESRTRRLAEELALLTAEVRHGPDGPDPDRPPPRHRPGP